MDMHRKKAVVLTFLGLSFLALAAVAGEDQEPARLLWRFEFDNDVMAQSDDFFTAGWSLQRHSGADRWEQLKLTAPSRWIAQHIPGIQEGDGFQLRKGIGFGQIIQTPGDLSETALITNDIPYAGVLGVANSWAALSDDAINTFQIYLGVLGPPSLAEEVQKFVHNDLNMGTDPRGWDNQLDTEPIVNLNYSLARKFARMGVVNDGFAGDFSYGASVGIGNLFTMAQAGLQTRIGWNLPPCPRRRRTRGDCRPRRGLARHEKTPGLPVSCAAFRSRGLYSYARWKHL